MKTASQHPVGLVDLQSILRRRGKTKWSLSNTEVYPSPTRSPKDASLDSSSDVTKECSFEHCIERERHLVVLDSSLDSSPHCTEQVWVELWIERHLAVSVLNSLTACSKEVTRVNNHGIQLKQ
jgi:hypothetical protein